MTENLKKRLYRRLILTAVCLFIPLSFLAFQTFRNVSTNRSFTAFTEELFRDELSGSTLNLHYTLANPQRFGIKDYPVTYGNLSTQSDSEGIRSLLTRLREFDRDKLSKENRMTYDILQYYLKNQFEASDLNLLYEPLSPCLGIQAQLPVLLAEYTFRTRQDLLDYLALLKQTDTYFANLLAFEQARARNGLFMSDKSAGRVIDQCSAFVRDRENNYLHTVFLEKLEPLGLSEKEKSAALSTHKNLLEKHFFPAYTTLISGLNDLKGTGKNPGGLSGYNGGKDYYRYLLRTQVGVSEEPEELWNRLTRQLSADLKEMQQLLQTDPSLIKRTLTLKDSPDEMLSSLQKKISADFPAPAACDYELKYVPDALKDYLSPAFYLTPPLDTGSPNTIYLNPAGNLAGLELFTTLAHEAFPGHLYQTCYFAGTAPDPLRALYEPSGYIEGWATYTESYAYGYAGEDAELLRLLWLNRSSGLCLYSLLDIGVHYFGWDSARTAAFLEGFGIADSARTAEIYQTIIETPANYLKYYVGYLHFLDLKNAQQEKLGADFNLKEFHRELLELGPCPFEILKDYIQQI